jgi:PPM family protein phosphatase
MTVALVENGVVAFGHVGDSRGYLIRDGQLEQLTEDHSLVAELVRSGKLSPEEAETHPQRSVITRALGTDPDVDVDTFSVEAQTGDLFMLCSDGLTSMVDDTVILSTVEKHRADLQGAAKALIRAANRGGGEDNITVIFFEIGEPGDERLSATAAYPTLDEPEPEPQPDDEDTLDELDRVPAVSTMVVPPEQTARLLEEARRPAQRKSGRVLPTIALLALVLAIAVIVVWTLTR